MADFFSNVLTASLHGSIVILAVLLLRIVLRGAPRKFICFLWMLAGLRLLLPIPLQSPFSLQPAAISIPLSVNLSLIVPILWGINAAVITAYSAVSYWNLRQKVVDAVKVRGGAWETDRIETAFVLGFFKPKIYIPTGMSAETRRQILAHERTHLDKGDHWMKLIGFLALALHWFNPLVWVAYILLCKDIEMACDERVVRFLELDERKAYATALLKCSTNHVHYAACPVAFGEVSVKYRIQSALNYKKPGLLGSLLGVLAIAFVAVCLVTSPAQAEVVDRQEQLAVSSRQDPVAFAPAVLPESEPNPDWGIDLMADITSPNGGKIVYIIEDRFVKLTGEMECADAHLEKWNGREWEFLAAVDDPLWHVGFAQIREQLVEYWDKDIDWTLTCGSLKAGDYRFVQTISTGERSEIMRVPFHIYREQLPDAQEEAISRCETALAKLVGSAYQVTLSHTNPNGKLVPYRSMTEYGMQYQSEHYLDGFTTWHATGEKAQGEMQDWEKDFYLNQNRKFLFPEGKSLISQEEIRFCSVWVDYDGIVYRGTDTYCFAPDGKLVSADRITEVLDESGAVAQTREIRLDAQPVDLTSSLPIENEYVPEDSFEAQKKSPWNVFFRVDDDLLNPAGGEIWLATNAVGVSNITTDGTYWLEKRVSSRWQRLGGEDKTASWDNETIQVTAQTAIRNVDWTADYGSLDAGVYRMGKHFNRGSESIIAYAEFAIPETGGVFGEGGAEALARVDAALARLAESTYRVEQWYGPYTRYSDESTLVSVYWHHGDTQVWDIYRQGAYSHSVTDKPDGFSYGSWMRRVWNNGPYDCMYFPEGYSTISDSEITFVQSYGRTGWTDTSALYTYRFDENGDICEISWQYLNNVLSDGFGIIRFVVTPTPENEIRAWVEQHS